jgi:hypothetical protein
MGIEYNENISGHNNKINDLNLCTRDGDNNSPSNASGADKKAPTNDSPLSPDTDAKNIYCLEDAVKFYKNKFKDTEMTDDHVETMVNLLKHKFEMNITNKEKSKAIAEILSLDESNMLKYLTAIQGGASKDFSTTPSERDKLSSKVEKLLNDTSKSDRDKYHGIIDSFLNKESNKRNFRPNLNDTRGPEVSDLAEAAKI